MTAPAPSGALPMPGDMHVDVPIKFPASSRSKRKKRARSKAKYSAAPSSRSVRKHGFNPSEVRDFHGRWSGISDHSLKLVRDQKAAKGIADSIDHAGEKEITHNEIDAWSNRLQNPRILFAHDENGKVLGHVIYDEHGKKSDDVAIREMRLASSSRGKGVGSGMIKHLQEKYPNRELKVYNALESAKPFYSKTGAEFTPGNYSGQWEPKQPNSRYIRNHKNQIKLVSENIAQIKAALKEQGKSESSSEYLKSELANLAELEAKSKRLNISKRHFNPSELRGPHGRWARSGEAKDWLDQNPEFKRRAPKFKGAEAGPVSTGRAHAKKLPRASTIDERNRANAWAKENLPTAEEKYAGLVVRLSGRGVAQNPAKRQELADRYGLDAGRLHQIEDKMHSIMYGDNPKTPVPGKAVDPNAKRRIYIDSRTPDGQIIYDRQGRLVSPKEFQAHVERQRAMLEESDMTRQQKVDEKHKIAAAWAERNGYDPTDTAIHAAYWRDQTLATTQHGPSGPPPRKVTVRRKKKGSGPSDQQIAAAAEAAAQHAAENPRSPGTAPQAPAPKMVPTAPTPSRVRRTSGVARPKSPTSSGTRRVSGGKAPKREPKTFSSQPGLPLNTAGGASSHYTPIVESSSAPKTVVRKASAADMARLFPKTGQPPRGHENIRVPTKPMSGLGAFDYMFDHREVKSGKVVPNRRKYSQEHDIAGQKQKFERVARISEHMPELDKRIARDANKNDAAGAVAMMRILAMRPSSDSSETRLALKDKNGNVLRDAAGGIQYSDPIPTYGATTLQRQHVSFDGNTAVISLTGKAAHEINLRTDDPTVVGLLRARMSKKGKPTDKLFNTTPDETIAYIKQTMPDIKNKDLRTYVATSIAKNVVDSMPPPQSLGELKNHLKDVSETTANQLQHGAGMSLASYIDPRVFMEWFKSAGGDYYTYENPSSGRTRKIVAGTSWQDAYKSTSRARRTGG